MNTRYRQKALFLALDDVIVKGSRHDSYDSLEWVEGVFTSLHEIAVRTDYALVLYAKVPGVGTPSLPRESFSGPMDRIISTLSGEGIVFDETVLDYSLPEDQTDSLSLLSPYRTEGWDLSGSFVITADADDDTAERLGSGKIVLGGDNNWKSVAAFLTGNPLLKHRTAAVERTTKETSIALSLDLDGTGKGHIHTGLGFFDHMLEQIVKHSRADIEGRIEGDLYVDEHHTVEDTAIVLGETVLKALGEKRGIERYGFEILMMDDVVATVAIDFSGRDEFIWDVEFTMDYVGSFPTELFRHFFRSFASSARANLYVSATRGGNSHHTAEIIFKAFARALRKAVRLIPGETGIPSSKGVL